MPDPFDYLRFKPRPAPPPYPFGVTGQTPVVTQDALYLGCVGTRCNVPWGYNSGLGGGMSRTGHFARDAITQIKVVYPNLYIDTNNNGDTWKELGTGTTATLKVGFETASGSKTSFTYNGSTSGFATSGAYLESDWLTVSLNVNDKFYLRPSFVNTGGILYMPQAADVTFGDSIEFTSADKSVSGTVGNDFAGYAFFPAAIVAMTRKRTFLLIGTSRTFWQADAVDGVSGDVGELSRAVGPVYGYCNAGIPADTAQRAAAAFTKRAALGNAYFSDIIISHGVNDEARTFAQFSGDMQTMFNSFPAKRVHSATIMPHTSGAWTLADGSDQTVGGGDHTTFNAWLKSSPSPCVGCYDINAIVSMASNANKWRAPGKTSDGLHGLPATYGDIQGGLTI